MIGFLPQNSTKQNLEHGQKLLTACNHTCVKELNRLWQNPNMYYAFESKNGARWLAKHGGPPKFMQMVSDELPEKKYEPIVPKAACEVKCYSCAAPFKSFTEPTRFKVHRCTCGERICHEHCFVAENCAICGAKYSVKCVKKIIKDFI